MLRRRQERMEARSAGTRYQMRQKLISFGNDFWIEDDQGQRVFKVDGKAMRIHQTLILEDLNGRELFKIQERMLRVRDTMEVEGPTGQRVAMVKKAIITPIRNRWSVKVADGPDLAVQGNILDYEYAIGEGGNRVAEVSRKWFRVQDTYGVQVEPGQDDALILAVTVAIDMMR